MLKTPYHILAIWHCCSKSEKVGADKLWCIIRKRANKFKTFRT